MRWKAVAAVALALGLLCVEAGLHVRRLRSELRREQTRSASEQGFRKARQALIEAGGPVAWPEHPSGTLDFRPDTFSTHQRLLDLPLTDPYPGTRTLLLVGTENTEGYCHPGEHFGAVMGRIVRDRGVATWRTASVAAPYGSARTAADRYLRQGVRVPHDLMVFVVDAGADLARHRLPPQARRRSLRLESAGLLLPAAVMRRIERRADGSAERWHALEALAQDASGPVDQVLFQALAFQDHPDSVEPALRRTVEAARDAARAAQGLGVPTIVVVLPSAWDSEPDTISDSIETFRRRIGLAATARTNGAALRERLVALLRESDLSVVDASPAFSDWHRRFPGERLFWSSGYALSAKGHYVLGEALLGPTMEVLNRPAGTAHAPP